MKKLSKALVAGAASAAMLFTGFAGASSAFAVDASNVAEPGNIQFTNATATDTFTGYMPFSINTVADGTYAYKINTDKGFTAAKLMVVINGLPDNLDFTKITVEEGKAVTEGQILSWLSDNFSDTESATKDSAKAKAFAQAIIDAAATQDFTASFTDVKKDSTELTNLPAGYYVIKHTATDNDHTKSLYLAGNVEKDSPLEITLKNGTVTSLKKVLENDKDVTDNEGTRIPNYTFNHLMDTNDTNKWDDVADYSIGQDIPYVLVGTLPDKYDEYSTFSYKFTDTMSKGLTYNDDAKVYADNNGTLQEITSNFNIEAVVGEDNTVLTIAAKEGGDLKGLKSITKDDKNADVTINKDTKIVVKYTAKLNNNAVIGLDGNHNEMTLEFSNNPYSNGDGDKGTTPEDKVVVFTYELDVTKVDGNNSATKLKDAEFKLWKDADKTKAAQIVNNKFQGWVDGDKGTTLTTPENGKFVIQGLDDGTYYLEETKAPAGYNKLENLIKLEVKATTVNNQAWDGTADKALTKLQLVVNGGEPINGDTSTGIVATDVQNNKGTNLPSTGGMGTTILYTVGALIVLAAGAGLAITMRRRNA